MDTASAEQELKALLAKYGFPEGHHLDSRWWLKMANGNLPQALGSLKLLIAFWTTIQPANSKVIRAEFDNEAATAGDGPEFYMSNLKKHRPEEFDMLVDFMNTVDHPAFPRAVRFFQIRAIEELLRQFNYGFDIDLRDHHPKIHFIDEKEQHQGEMLGGISCLFAMFDPELRANDHIDLVNNRSAPKADK